MGDTAGQETPWLEPAQRREELLQEISRHKQEVREAKGESGCSDSKEWH